MSNVISRLGAEHEPWERLWLPLEAWDQHRGVDEGFLPDSESSGDLESLLDPPLPGTGRLKDHEAKPFLMLLGRPGSGKSRELEIACESGSLGSPSILIEGKAFGSMDPGLYLQTFFPQQLAQPARIIIDGLDEVLLTNPSFVAQLKAWFRLNAGPEGKPRHRLAISCRWADWPEPQVADLESLWPAGGSEMLVLAPLRRKDAVGTLKQKLGETKAEEFWAQLRALRLEHVACWPEGFLELIEDFRDSGLVATSHADVIGKRVIRRCRLADNPGDPVRWQQSVEGAEWRQRIAGRIAATLAVSGKTHLTLGGGGSTGNTDALTPADLGTTEEIWEGRRVRVHLADIDAVLHRTSLMRRLSGTEAWVFESQVHQEWLAADWLAVQKLGGRQLRQLFGVEIEGRWTVAPSMRAIAAWLARIDGDFRIQVLSHDPLTLLRMDGASLPEAERREVVDALLKATDGIRVLDPAIRHSHLPSLRHGGLADQLKGWIENPDATDAAKLLGIELAEKTELKELADFLWSIFPASSKRLKIEIAGALRRLAKEGFDDQWRAVLQGGIVPDAHGTLLGAALELMVVDSDKVAVRDVLGQVFPERRFEAFGLYDAVVRDLHDHLCLGDLPAVLGVLVKYPRAYWDSLSRVKDFNDRALRLGLKYIDREDIAQALVGYWHASLNHHYAPIQSSPDLWLADDTDSAEEKRRRFVNLLITHPGFERHRKHRWLSASDYLLEDDDFEWCLDQLGECEVEFEWRYALLISTLIWRVDVSGNVSERLRSVWLRSESLRALLPVPESGETIDQAIARVASDEASKRNRKEAHFTKRQEQRRDAHRERMAKGIEQCQQAHDDGKIVWPRAFQILMFRDSEGASGIVSFESIHRIEAGDQWIRDAAARFLIECPLHHEIDHNYGLYGLLALAACVGELDRDGQVRESIERHWLKQFIPQLCNHDLGETPAGISNERFAELFPEAFCREFEAFCRGSYRNDGSLSELHQLAGIGLLDLGSILKSILRDEPFHPAGFFTGFWFLSRRDEDAAIEVALKWLPELDGDMPRDAAASLLGASAVLLNGRLSGELERHLKKTDLVSDSIRAAASRLSWYEREIDYSVWPDGALQVLADACWRAFRESDRHRKKRGQFEFSSVNDVDHAMEFRDRISSAAWSRGIEVVIPPRQKDDSDDEAVERQHLADWYRNSTFQTRAGAKWVPLFPQDFLRFADRPNARLARDTGELLDAVMESLALWEESLVRQGKWHRLWNHETIKHETVIAQEMREWLNEKLDVVVECEITLASQDRSDVLVKTQAGVGLPALTVVIEVKKWRSGNAKERREAMKSQLVDRYLRERLHEGWTHGLYVIAWTPKPGGASDSDAVIERERVKLKKQEAELSEPPFTVKSMVIDARYRGKTPEKAANKRLGAAIKDPKSGGLA